MTGSKGTIVLDKRVLMANVVLKVKEVPLFYLPILYYPINKRSVPPAFCCRVTAPRLCGVRVSATPSSGPLDARHDATIYHDWFASTGNGVGAEYRYKTPVEPVIPTSM
jgi:lipopolysaccharide assembly outer membrane protein LptD (OstA)